MSQSCLSAKQIPNAWIERIYKNKMYNTTALDLRRKYLTTWKQNVKWTEHKVEIWKCEQALKFIMPEWHYRRVLWRKITKYQLTSLAGFKEKNHISSAVHDVFIPRVATFVWKNLRHCRNGFLGLSHKTYTTMNWKLCLLSLCTMVTKIASCCFSSCPKVLFQGYQKGISICAQMESPIFCRCLEWMLLHTLIVLYYGCVI